MCRNQVGPKTHRATGGGLTVIMQSYLASRRQARPPSPLILHRVLEDVFVQPVGRTIRQIHIRSDCHVTPCFTSSIQIKTHPKGVPSKKDSVLQGVYFSLDLPAFWALLFLAFLSWHFPVSALPLILFCFILSAFPQFINVYIYMCTTQNFC